MKIHELFLKPVDRPIDGVIKADDARNLQTELEEYVVTRDVARGLGIFTEVPPMQWPFVTAGKDHPTGCFARVAPVHPEAPERRKTLDLGTVSPARRIWRSAREIVKGGRWVACKED